MLRKRAFLVACPFGGLKGPQHDVETMAGVLRRNGFSDISICAGDEATREEILSGWQDLNRRLSRSDAVVIYYSGHGGLVEPSNDTGSDHDQPYSNPRQFLVPMDYDQTTPDDFRGILDVELSHLLQSTTDITDNVTLILDCCHSGSMARDPSFGVKAVQKSLDEVQYHTLIKHRDLLRQHGHLPGLADPLGNRKAVRIVAATADEKAWEYRDGTSWAGAMTRALAQVLDESAGQAISWRTTMTRVREVVRLKFSSQHPHVEGPYSRLHFSLQQSTADNTALPVSQLGSNTYIMAGKLREVYAGNVYSILPYGFTVFDGQQEITKATVQKVVGFKARVVLSPDVGLPQEGAVAFLRKMALPKWPAALSDNLPQEVRNIIQTRIAQSPYIELLPEPDDQSGTHLVRFVLEDEDVVLHSQAGVEVASQKIPTTEQAAPLLGDYFGGLVQVAEQMARAQQLLTLKALDQDGLSMANSLELEVAVTENNEKKRQVPTNGMGEIYPGERICIFLRNKGDKKVYVHLFNVNVAGKIQQVTYLSPLGIYVEPGSEAVVGADEFDDLVGLEVSWPDGIPKVQPVLETLVAIQADAAVDLSYLEGSADRSAGRAEFSMSLLEQLADSVATETSRDLGAQQGSANIRYQITVKRLMLGLQPPRRGAELPAPEELMKGLEQRALFGRLGRAIRNIEPFVWVINQHSEEITVVVSQYGPEWDLGGIGLNASATGAGLDLFFSNWQGPASTKILKPEREDRHSSAGRFPLWTRRNGFGVISIFTGTERKLFISNDQVPMGVIAYFVNRPNLRIVPYDKSLVPED